MLGLDRGGVSGRTAMAAVILAAAMAAPGAARAASEEAAAVGAGEALAQTPWPERARWKKRWIATWIAVAAVNVMDIHSSLAHGEANPLYRGRNGRFAPGKALAIKSAIAGGLLAGQLVVIRSNPEKNYFQPFTVTNAVTAGALSGVVARNYSLPKPAGAPDRAVPAHLAPQP